MAVSLGQPVRYRPGKGSGTDICAAQITRVNTAGDPANVDIVVFNDTAKAVEWKTRVIWRSTDNGATDICFPIASLS